jgi:hypothetical protein
MRVREMAPGISAAQLQGLTGVTLCFELLGT